MARSKKQWRKRTRVARLPRNREMSVRKSSSKTSELAVLPDERAEVKAGCYEQIAEILKQGLSQPPATVENLLALNKLNRSYREKILLKFVDSYLVLNQSESSQFNRLLKSKGIAQEVKMFKLEEEKIGEARGEARKEQEFRTKFITSIGKLLDKQEIFLGRKEVQSIKALSTDDLVQLQDGLIFDRITSNQQLQDWLAQKGTQQQSESSGSDRVNKIISAIENNIGHPLRFDREEIEQLTPQQLDKLELQVDNITELKQLTAWLHQNSSAHTSSESPKKGLDLAE